MNLIKGGIYSFHKNKGNQYYDFIIFLEQDFDKNFILITRNFYNKKSKDESLLKLLIMF